MFVPVPQVSSFSELNELLRARCLKYQNHTIRGLSQSVGRSFEIERSMLTALPKRQMEPIRQVIAKANHFAVVRFERNRYSVPTAYTGCDVTVKASVFEISIWHRGIQIASHPRSYGDNTVSYQLEHYLSLLEKKPRAVWNAQPVRHAKLPEDFWDFAKKLADDYEVVKLLQLASQYGISSTLQAMDRARDRGSFSYEGVLEYLAAPEQAKPVEPPVNPIEIKQVDLRTYDTMLLGGESA